MGLVQQCVNQMRADEPGSRWPREYEPSNNINHVAKGRLTTAAFPCPRAIQTACCLLSSLTISFLYGPGRHDVDGSRSASPGVAVFSDPVLVAVGTTGSHQASRQAQAAGAAKIDSTRRAKRLAKAFHLFFPGKAVKGPDHRGLAIVNLKG